MVYRTVNSFLSTRIGIRSGLEMITHMQMSGCKGRVHDSMQ